MVQLHLRLIKKVMYNSSTVMRNRIKSVFYLLGMLVVLASPVRVLAQFGNVGIDPPFKDDNEYIEGITDGTTAFTTLEKIVSNILALLTVLGGLVFITYFMLGAISWITSGGDTAKVGKARDQMLQGALGLIVLTMMYALVGLIGSIVGMNILNPAEVLETIVP